MCMTVVQIFFFWPIFAGLADKFWARKMLFWYASFFSLWAILWIISSTITDPVYLNTIVILMTICFWAGYWAKSVDVYTLRMSPSGNSGIAFWRLTTFAGLGRFLGTLIQPYLVSSNLQIRAPIGMLWAMALFSIFLLFIPNDVEHKGSTQNNKKPHHHIMDSIKNIIHNYKRTFIHWPLFVRRCNYYPLIPLSVWLREGIFFWSLWFIIPIYFSQHPEYLSHGLEIGIYEIINVFFAIICGYIADKQNSKYSIFWWWITIILALGCIYYYPSITILPRIGVIIALSNTILYATGQHILSLHDKDHEDDAVYGQTKNMITNIWYMIMPMIRWFTSIEFEWILKIFANIMISFSIIWVIIAFYIFFIRAHRYKSWLQWSEQ